MANTYTSDLGAAEGRIQSLTQAVSSGISGLPGINDALRKAVMEREKTLPGLEKENEAKIQELYTADKRYAETYANPQSGMYIENPMQRQGLVSGQKADIRGELGNILNLIQSRQQTMGNAIDKGMELYKMGLEAQKLELDQAEKTWSRIMEKMQFDESKKRAGAGDISQARLNQMVLDLENGTNLTDAMKKYSTYFSPDDIYSQYTIHSPYVSEAIKTTGRPVYESPQQLQSQFGITRELKYRQSGLSDQELDSNLQRIMQGQARLDDYTPTQQQDMQTRAATLGIGEIGPSPTASNYKGFFGIGGVNSETQSRIEDAQANIDEYTNPLERASVYQKWISKYPDIRGYIHY